MKKLLSIVLAVMMILSLGTTSFAAGEKLAVTATEDATGLVTFEVKMTGAAVGGFYVRLNTTGLSYVADSLVLNDKFAAFDIAENIAESDADTIKVGYTSLTASVSMSDEVLLTFECQASGDWSADFMGTTSKKKTYFLDGSTEYSNKNNKDVVTLAVVPYEGGDDEEVFEITKTETAVAGTDTMKDENGADVAAAGDKVVAIFAKNVTDVELEAGSYGIVFGGVTYAGQLAVPANTAWAIKLVGSAEQLPAGSYAYGIFAGDATFDATTPWVID